MTSQVRGVLNPLHRFVGGSGILLICGRHFNLSRFLRLFLVDEGLNQLLTRSVQKLEVL